MDKNNDIQVNKVNKWDYGVVDMSLWHLKDEFDALVDKLNGVYGIDVFEIEELTGDTYSSMDKVLERFNELETVHQKECGMISQYEEENRSLQEQVNKLINARIKLTRDNDDLRRERDRHIDLLDKLRWALVDKGIYCEWNEAALKWNVLDTANICESCKQHYEEELRIRCKGIDDKNKLIEELKQKNEELESKNKCLDFKYHMIKTIGYGRHIIPLKEKIQTLEKENKDLKDTLEKDGEFGKNIGKRVVDSIREGCDKGVYKLHPLSRIDIHVEETNNMPTTFDRHAIPRISVIFNNTQTEIERDTAEHECEELDKKFKELVKENIELRTTLAMCERDANAAKNLCDNIAFNAERARNKTPWFNDT